MPRNAVVTHSSRVGSNARSWLDLYSTSQTLVHNQDARLLSRINKIKEHLASIRQDIDIQRQLVGLLETNGKYCTTCSRRPFTSHCSTSCPLLRGDQGGWSGHDSIWVHFAKMDVQLFDELEYEVSTYAHVANKQMVQNWHIETMELLVRMEDSPNHRRMRPMRTNFPGFNQDWTFEGRWGKGPGIEVELAPDEVEISAEHKA